MANIASCIDKLNKNNQKALSVFLTAGYPDKNDFVRLALEVLENGADMLEIGIPFSDPIAAGPVIQQASQKALRAGITMDHIFNYVREIRSQTGKPLILMGYANPVMRYGIKSFIETGVESGVNGVIVPDIPLEEYDGFWGTPRELPEVIQLTTPTSTEARIKAIDARSRGFVYCVSVTGTTGGNTAFDVHTLENVKRTYQILQKNKMLIGFGISGPEDVRIFAPYCDGVIVGSAVIRRLQGESGNRNYTPALELISELSEACHEF